jgi:hypothetical protein
VRTSSARAPAIEIIAVCKSDAPTQVCVLSMTDVILQSSTTLLVVEGDRACIHCGYNLRTLRQEGNCPECGWAVAKSLREASLAGVNVPWLVRAALGLGMLIAAWAAMTVAVTLDASDHFWFTGMALTGGPAGARASLAGYLLNRSFLWQSVWVVASLFIQAAGIVTLAWPGSAQQRRIMWLVRIMLWGVAGGSVFFAMGMVFDVQSRLRLWYINFRDLLPWLLIFDTVCIALTAAALTTIATCGEFNRTARWAKATALLQLAGMLILAALVIMHWRDDPRGVEILSLILMAAGGAGMLVVSGCLMVAVTAELYRRWRFEQ